MPRHILLIQDDPASALAIMDMLNRAQESFEVEWVRCSEDGIMRLQMMSKGKWRGSSDGFAAVLMDLAVPDRNGIAAFDALSVAASHIPILVLCDESEEEIAKICVQRGAQDYLLINRLDRHLLLKTLNTTLERVANAASLFKESVRAEVTLDSICDAIVSTDIHCTVTYLNSVAEKLTGWARAEALGRPIEEVFNVIDAATRARIENPTAMAMLENKTGELAPNCLLIRRDGVELAVEDSAAPICDRHGRVIGAVVVFRDVTAARAMSQRMSYLAQHDGLTGLSNRIVLSDRLNQAIASARRHQKKLALLFLDVDGFKHVNDSLGHAIGDRLLQSIAVRLRACVRTSDTVSRQGGDEFVVLLTEVAHAADAEVAAEKLLKSLREPHRIDNREVCVTASIGIVTYPDDGEDVDTLLGNADLAMYQAKHRGRDKYQLFPADTNGRLPAQSTPESAIRLGVACEQLFALPA